MKNHCFNHIWRLLLALALVALPLQAAAGLRGDVNGDGEVNITDATKLIANLLGGDNLIDQYNADVNRDGEINITDATTLIAYILGNLDFPPEEEEFNVGGVSFVMIPVEGGTFTMGATNEQGTDANDRERPVHQVTLSTYYIAQTEVTQELWIAVMGDNPSYFRDSTLPVESVSWDDCQQFIAALNALTGRTFRLPTEAEWEFAARGGIKSEGYKYAGSDMLDAVGWYSGNDSWMMRGTDYYGTHYVATRNPNELGLNDMSGNVHEWCQDWFAGYSIEAQTNPTGPSSGTGRVYRGGCWYFDQWFCRVSFRNSVAPSYRSYGIGMRLALDAQDI